MLDQATTGDERDEAWADRFEIRWLAMEYTWIAHICRDDPPSLHISARRTRCGKRAAVVTIQRSLGGDSEVIPQALPDDADSICILCAKNYVRTKKKGGSK